MMDDVAKIAAGLSAQEQRFLIAVCDGQTLGLADRAEDRVRQKLRRAGLVFVAKCPRRWMPMNKGYTVRAYLQETMG